MKLNYAKRMLVNAAIAHAQRVTNDVTRLAVLADEYVATVRKNAKADKLAVVEAAASHVQISRSAGTTYRQLRRLYPPLPVNQLAEPPIIQGSAHHYPPASNTGDTFPEQGRDPRAVSVLTVDGKPVDVWEVLGGYV